jgi:membrane protease YdiL (CAAX protease family)
MVLITAPTQLRPAAGTGRLRSLIARRPLTAFLVIAFALAYPLMSVPILASRGSIPGGSIPGMLHIAPDELAGVLLTLGALVPATLIVTWCADGRAGIVRLARRLTHWRIGIGWWLLLLAGLPVLTTGLALLLGDSLNAIDPLDMALSQLRLLGINLLLVNLWEEAAWAGLVQTRLERRHNIVVAALLTAMPFALAHLPLALFGAFTAGSLAGSLGLYLVLGVLVRPMLAVVLRGTRDSLLAVALLHSIFNRTNNENGIAARLVDGQARSLTMLLAVIVLTAAVAVAFRRRLTRSYRAELDAGGHGHRAQTRPGWRRRADDVAVEGPTHRLARWMSWLMMRRVNHLNTVGRHRTMH